MLVSGRVDFSGLCLANLVMSKGVASLPVGVVRTFFCDQTAGNGSGIPDAKVLKFAGEPLGVGPNCSTS